MKSHAKKLSEAKPAAAHAFRVGDAASCVCSKATYNGKIVAVSPLRVCLQVDGLCVWFRCVGDRWVGDDNTSLVPR